MQDQTIKYYGGQLQDVVVTAKRDNSQYGKVNFWTNIRSFAIANPLIAILLSITGVYLLLKLFK